MKKITIALALTLSIFSSRTFAFQSSFQLTAIATAEVIVWTAISVATTEAFTISTNEIRKVEAQKIIREIQEYNQTGHVSLYLAEKISIVNQINSDFSESESVDVLIAATKIILSE